MSRRQDVIVLFIVVLFLFQVPALYWPLYLLSVASIVYFWRASVFREDVSIEIFFVVLLFVLSRLLVVMQITSFSEFARFVVNGVSYVLIYLVVFIYCTCSIENCRRVSLATCWALSFSVCAYIACILWPSELYGLKQILYPEAVSIFEATGLSESGIYAFLWASGLSPYLHLFGYQLAALLGFTLSFFVAGGAWRSVGVFVIFIVSLVSIVAAQRSVLAAGVISFLFSVVYSTFSTVIRGAVIRTLLLIFIIAFVLYIVFEVGLGGDVADLPNLFDRFDSENVGERGGMQIAALKIIANKPFGLIGDFRDELFWGVEAMKLGYSVAIDPATNTYALVHNSYLRFPLELGWLAFVIVGAVCARLAVGCWDLLRCGRNALKKQPGLFVYAIALSGAVLSLSVQALFHNDSILTFESTSLVFVANMFGMRIALNRSAGSV